MFETTAESTSLPHQLVRLKRETNGTTSLFYSLPSSTLLVKVGAGWSLLRRGRIYFSPSPSPPLLSAELHVSHPYQSLGSIKARTSKFDSKLSSLEAIWDVKREETVFTSQLCADGNHCESIWETEAPDTMATHAASGN